MASWHLAFVQIMDPMGISNWSITHVDWSSHEWHPRTYKKADTSLQLFKGIQVSIRRFSACISASHKQTRIADILSVLRICFLLWIFPIISFCIGGMEYQVRCREGEGGCWPKLVSFCIGGMADLASWDCQSPHWHLPCFVVPPLQKLIGVVDHEPRSEYWLEFD